MKKLAYIMMAALLAGACGSGVKVTSDYDKTVDFSKYKTLEYFGWAENSDQILTQFDKERIESAFAREFNNRGWNVVESGGDAVVSLFIVVDKKTSYSTYTDHYNTGMYGGMYAPRYGYGYGYGAPYGSGFGTSTSTTVENNYLVGTLIVDVFDANTKNHIWQGIGKKTISENTSKREERINTAVAEIMKAFPVQPN